jgi:hypothetical protein
MIENELSGTSVDAEVEVHRTLGGPGLLESVSAPLRLCVGSLLFFSGSALRFIGGSDV